MVYEFIPTSRLEASIESLDNQLKNNPKTLTIAERDILYNMAIALKNREDSTFNSDYYEEIIERVQK